MIMQVSAPQLVSLCTSCLYARCVPDAAASSIQSKLLPYSAQQTQHPVSVACGFTKNKCYSSHPGIVTHCCMLVCDACWRNPYHVSTIGMQISATAATTTRLLRPAASGRQPPAAYLGSVTLNNCSHAVCSLNVCRWHRVLQQVNTPCNASATLG